MCEAKKVYWHSYKDEGNSGRQIKVWETRPRLGEVREEGSHRREICQPTPFTEKLEAYSCSILTNEIER